MGERASRLPRHGNYRSRRRPAGTCEMVLSLIQPGALSHSDHGPEVLGNMTRQIGPAFLLTSPPPGCMGCSMNRTYDASVFEVENMEQAKRIILTAENSTTEQRWARETPYLARMIGRYLRPTAQSTLLDFGCGIGRMSKELIWRYGCRAIGADISDSMRDMAPRYVDSSRFSICAPADLGQDIADMAIAIWVLQHCESPTLEIGRIHKAVKPRGRLFVAKSIRRVVPAAELQLFTAVPTMIRRWTDDGEDVKARLAELFTLEEQGEFPAHLPGIIPGRHYWAVFTKA